MLSRKYTVLVADRSSGVVRRATLRVGSTIAAVLAVLSLPILIGLGARWSARTEIDQLRATNAVLLVENGSYRAATGELTAQIQSLEGVIDDLGTRAALPLEQVRAMQKLPVVVRSHASGGTVQPNAAGSWRRRRRQSGPRMDGSPVRSVAAAIRSPASRAFTRVSTFQRKRDS